MQYNNFKGSFKSLKCDFIQIYNFKSISYIKQSMRHYTIIYEIIQKFDEEN